LIGLHCNSNVLTKDLFSKIFSSRIPSDFPWPKFAQSTSVNTNRIPLSTITNRTSSIKKNLSIVKTENQIPIMNSNQFHSTHDFNITPNNYPDSLQVNIHENGHAKRKQIYF
jgi:hypothetical protein